MSSVEQCDALVPAHELTVIRRRHSTWEKRYALALVLLDLASAAAAALIAHRVRFSGRPDARMYVDISALVPLAWLGTLAVNHAYDRRTLRVPG